MPWAYRRAKPGLGLMLIAKGRGGRHHEVLATPLSSDKRTQPTISCSRAEPVFGGAATAPSRRKRELVAPVISSPNPVGPVPPVTRRIDAASADSGQQESVGLYPIHDGPAAELLNASSTQSGLRPALDHSTTWVPHSDRLAAIMRENLMTSRSSSTRSAVTSLLRGLTRTGGDRADTQQGLRRAGDLPTASAWRATDAN